MLFEFPKFKFIMTISQKSLGSGDAFLKIHLSNASKIAANLLNNKTEELAQSLFKSVELFEQFKR